MSKLAAAVFLLVLAGCATQSNPPYAADVTACVNQGFTTGTSAYRACINDRIASYDERSNRWRIEQSN